MFDMDTTGLPPEVAAQAELVKKFMSEGGGATEGDAGARITVANTDQAQQNQHAQQSEGQQQSQQQEGQQAQPATDLAAEMQNTPQQPEGQQQSQQQTAQEENTPAQSADDAAEQRYRVLQGIHKADVARLTQQVRDLQAELEKVRGGGQSAVNNLAANDSAQANTSGAAADDLDDQLEAARLEGDFEQVKALRTKIKERDRQEMRQELLKETEPIRQQAVLSADERYTTDLNVLAPDWNKFRVDPAFAAFLQQPAPFTGVALFEILNQADSARDALRVSEIYNAFKEQKAAATGGFQAEQQPQQQQQRTLPQSLVTPARTSGASAPTPAPKVITAEQLEAAASDVGKGLITPEAYSTLQNQYFQQSVFKQ